MEAGTTASTDKQPKGEEGNYHCKPEHPYPSNTASPSFHGPTTGGEYIPTPYLMPDGSVMYPAPVKVYSENAFYPGYDYSPECGYYLANQGYCGYGPAGSAIAPPAPPHISYRSEHPPVFAHDASQYRSAQGQMHGTRDDFGGTTGDDFGARCLPNGFDYYADDELLFHDYNCSVQNVHNSHFPASGASSGHSQRGPSKNRDRDAAPSDAPCGPGVSNFNNALLYGPGPPIVTSSVDEPVRIKGPPGSNLFCFHLPNEITNWDLYLLFRRFGSVLSVHTMVNRQSGLSRGYGFISYENPLAAERAIQHMDGFRLGKKRLKVQRKRDIDPYYSVENLHEQEVSGAESYLEDTAVDSVAVEENPHGGLEGVDMDLRPTPHTIPPAAVPAPRSTAAPAPVPSAVPHVTHVPQGLTRREPCNSIPTPPSTCVGG